jgi:hypothetical protein
VLHTPTKISRHRCGGSQHSIYFTVILLNIAYIIYTTCMYANYCGTSGGENVTLNVQNGPKKTSQTSLLDLCSLLPAGSWLLDAIFATAGSWLVGSQVMKKEERVKSESSLILSPSSSSHHPSSLPPLLSEIFCAAFSSFSSAVSL